MYARVSLDGLVQKMFILACFSYPAFGFKAMNMGYTFSKGHKYSVVF
jgi:hypothetical protein